MEYGKNTTTKKQNTATTTTTIYTTAVRVSNEEWFSGLLFLANVPQA